MQPSVDLLNDEEEMMSRVDIRDPFAHEAAHALVYDALGITVARIWVQGDDAGREWGLTERGADVQITHGSGVLEFMSGAGVLVHIFAQPFDRTIIKVKSDLCTVLRFLSFDSEQEARAHLARLRIATDDFVREWILTHKNPIMHLASLLQEKHVGDKRWELSGIDLGQAMQRCWAGSKPQARTTQEFADARWKHVLDRNDALPDTDEWQTVVLRDCRGDSASPQ